MRMVLFENAVGLKLIVELLCVVYKMCSEQENNEVTSFLKVLQSSAKYLQSKKAFFLLQIFLT
jgi:hypothetical protein